MKAMKRTGYQRVSKVLGAFCGATKESTAAHLHASRGSALILSMLVLLLLTVIGIFAVSTSTMETRISGIDREFREAFYTGDSGGSMGINVVREILHEVPSSVADLDPPWDNASVIDSSLFSGTSPELYSDGRNPDTPESEPPDIQSQGDSNNLGLSSATQLRVDVDRLNACQLAGGGTEFAAAYEGMGKGVAGAVGIVFVMDSLGRSSSAHAQAEIETGYLHVVGVPGGMEVTS